MHIINRIQVLVWLLCPGNHIVRLLPHITDVLTYKQIMPTGKGCAYIAITIETNWFVVSNAVTEFADVG
ncbi:MAG: hypothetical protein IJK46_05225 [Prevotella sp.]|nr:hypothetical protein [Prevotella sp.]